MTERPPDFACRLELRTNAKRQPGNPGFLRTVYEQK
jgi:hypothetical protein